MGQELTASTSGIEDTDGLASVTYAYQWLRVDSGTETEISGETSSSYELAADDAGKRVKVRVSFADDAMNDEVLTSAAFPMSGTVAMAPPVGPAEAALGDADGPGHWLQLSWL